MYVITINIVLPSRIMILLRPQPNTHPAEFDWKAFFHCFFVAYTLTTQDTSLLSIIFYAFSKLDFDNPFCFFFLLFLSLLSCSISLSQSLSLYVISLSMSVYNPVAMKVQQAQNPEHRFLKAWHNQNKI